MRFRSCLHDDPVDSMRLLENADRHLGRFYLHVTPLKALLDMYPAYIACDSADSTVAHVSTVRMCDCGIAATSKCDSAENTAGRVPSLHCM